MKLAVTDIVNIGNPTLEAANAVLIDIDADYGVANLYRPHRYREANVSLPYNNHCFTITHHI